MSDGLVWSIIRVCSLAGGVFWLFLMRFFLSLLEMVSVI